MVDNSKNLERHYENRRLAKKPFFKYSATFIIYLGCFAVVGALVWAEIDYGYVEELVKLITE